MTAAAAINGYRFTDYGSRNVKVKQRIKRGQIYFLCSPRALRGLTSGLSPDFDGQ